MKRYDLEVTGGHGYTNHEMIANDYGDWVRYEDVEALLARVRELEGELRSVDQVLDRRDALADSKTRVDKLLVLLRCAQANDPKAELAKSEATVRELEQARDQTIAEMRSAVELSKQFGNPVADHQLILDWAAAWAARDAARPQGVAAMDALYKTYGGAARPSWVDGLVTEWRAKATRLDRLTAEAYERCADQLIGAVQDAAGGARQQTEEKEKIHSRGDGERLPEGTGSTANIATGDE